MCVSLLKMNIVFLAGVSKVMFRLVLVSVVSKEWALPGRSLS